MTPLLVADLTSTGLLDSHTANHLLNILLFAWTAGPAAFLTNTQLLPSGSPHLSESG